MKKLVIRFNAPVVLLFALLSLLVLLLDGWTGGVSTTRFFCVYRSSLADPLTYVRFFGHVLGHSGYSHYMNNMLLLLLVGPGLEEKYGSRNLLMTILVTALVTGLVQFIFFPGTALLGASGVVFMMIVLNSFTEMRRGGTFSVATGRALPSFSRVREGVPMNGPTVLFNGAAIYDFAQQRYLYTAFLPESVRGHICRLLEDLPETALEIYHDDDSIHAINPNEITYHHLHLTHSPTVALASMEEVPSPISKLLFEEAEPRMTALREYIARQSWSTEYEVVPSNPYLLELTAKGANKGGMVRRLAQMLEIRQENVYCVGDHANDIPMLTFARTAFAPANAIQPVHEVPGIHILPNCWENAIAAMIAEPSPPW